MRALLALLKRRDANKDWLLTVLWCVDRANPIFDKSYMYQRPQTSQVNFMPLIPNEENFFDDCPQLDQRQLRRKQLRLPKALRHKLEYERLIEQ